MFRAYYVHLPAYFLMVACTPLHGSTTSLSSAYYRLIVRVSRGTKNFRLSVP